MCGLFPHEHSNQSSLVSIAVLVSTLTTVHRRFIRNQRTRRGSAVDLVSEMAYPYRYWCDRETCRLGSQTVGETRHTQQASPEIRLCRASVLGTPTRHPSSSCEAAATGILANGQGQPSLGVEARGFPFLLPEPRIELSDCLLWSYFIISGEHPVWTIE